MTDDDLQFVTRLVERGVIGGPVLELGAGYGGDTCRDIVRAAGLDYFATDVAKSTGVDFVADFGDEGSVRKAFQHVACFSSVLVLNVLEHTFDPIRILDNASDLLCPGGVLVVITPAVWPLHNYPIDCCRLLPDWYEQYGAKRKLSLDREYFEYVGFCKVDDNRDTNRNYKFPPPTRSKYKYRRSRIIQRLFDTYGRGMTFPGCVAIGAVLRKP